MIRSHPNVYVIGRDNACPILVGEMPDGNTVAMRQPLSFTIPATMEFGSWGGLEVLVPTGFMSDKASVPFGFRNLFPKHGKYTKAAFIHDFLYVIQRTPRWVADLVFLHAMRALGVPEWKAQIMYRAVRIGGWAPWRANARMLVKFPVKFRLKYGLWFRSHLYRPQEHPRWGEVFD